jgi:hypothetical protein
VRKRSKADADETAADPADGQGRAGLGVVPPLSLLAGGLATYPSLSAAAEGRGDLLEALALFLTASLVAMVGFGIVALTIRSGLAQEPDGDDGGADRAGATAATGAEPGARAAETGPLPLALGDELDDQPAEIDQALAATDALLHEDAGSSR